TDLLLNLSYSNEDKKIAFYLKSVTEFYKGNYEKALDYGNRVNSKEINIIDNDIFLNHILRVSNFGMKFNEVNTEHFKIRYSNPKDIILTRYAEKILESAYHEVGLDLDIYPEEPVIVEIYPDLENFIIASTLSEKDIKTTGVVGICKFNRIIILSPRLLPKGYTWFDTLTHEYTHYLIFIKSENKTPVWLHEGIAKFEEKRWKDAKRNTMTPFYESLLARALKDDKLVPIEKMHPSFGKLSNSYEAQLAFAQAGTTIDFLVNNWGNGAIKNLLTTLKQKNDYRASIKEVTEVDFEKFYNLWLEDLIAKNLSERIPELEVNEIRFRNRNNAEDNSEDLIDIKDIQAREYSRLGDILRTRGRLKAATYEYEKAMHFDPISPVVLNRLASSKNALGEYEESEQVLKPLLEFYPDYFDTHINLGLIYLNKSNLAKAEEALNNAISINPFDPQVHIALISLYEKQELLKLVEKENDVLRIILGEASNDEQIPIPN
ncbi:MAG: peptidase MA family metallohydrolase, partial [Thermodesulfobacteriota bacterium]